MLVARRDPPFESGAHDDSRPVPPYHAHLPQQPRFMTALQVVATLVGIPVGLASAYSIYHSNFTDEARCETLRGNIVSMLDKSADASTLRMLVRRDVVNFESKCGAVDPDAVKAFKMLLAQKPAEVPPVARQPVREPMREVKQVPPKVAPVAAVKPVEAKRVEPTAAEAPPSTRDSEAADAKWIASVRDALIHTPAAHAAVPPAPAPAAPTHALGQLRAAPEAPPAALVAPALPAPVPVAAPPAAVSPADHPVPPGEIPDTAPAAKPAETSNHSWMSKVPILNRVVGD